MYSIDDPDAVKIIYGMSNPMPKSNWYLGWADPSVTNHNLLVVQDVKFHAIMRRKVASMYTMTTVKSYEPCVDNCTDVLTGQLDKLATSGSEFNLPHWMQCYAFDVIGELTVSTRCFSAI